MKTVQGILGHATIAMTMDMYTHILDKHKVDEMAKIQDEFDKIENKADDMVDKQFEEFKAKENEPKRDTVEIPNYSGRGRRRKK